MITHRRIDTFYFIASILAGAAAGLAGSATGRGTGIQRGVLITSRNTCGAQTQSTDHVQMRKSYFTWSGFCILSWSTCRRRALLLTPTCLMSQPRSRLPFRWRRCVAGSSMTYLCKSPIGQKPTGLMLVLFGVLVRWPGVYECSPVGTYTSLEPSTATIMSAIGDDHHRTKDVRRPEGRPDPDPEYGRIAKQTPPARINRANFHILFPYSPRSHRACAIEVKTTLWTHFSSTPQSLCPVEARALTRVEMRTTISMSSANGGGA